jgi:peptide/nickel transport system substrate-binding protein
MAKRTRRIAGAAVACTVALMSAACQANTPAAQNESGTGNAVLGGTLNMLGSGDVDYMDPNITYYSIGYLNVRMWARQLFNYPAVAGQVTTPVPDVATEIPTTSNGGVSADGKTYTIKLRDGVKWNSTPERPVVAQDFVRGLQRTCNPVQPFGGIPDFATLIKGYQGFCTGFSKVAQKPAAMAAYINSHSIEGAQAKNDHTLVFTLTQPATYFVGMLALPAFSAAPKEWLAYAPASPQLADHLLSDGP